MSLQLSPGVILTPSASKVATGQNYLGIDDFDFSNQYLPETDKKIWNRFGSQDITGMLKMLGKEKSFASDQILWKEEARLRMLGTGVTRSANVFTLVAHNYRVNETIVVRNDSGSILRQGKITAVTDDTFTALCGESAGWTDLGTTALTVYVDSNEWAKDTKGFTQSLDSKFSSFSQQPVIIKEMVKESGSNMAQITWLYVENTSTGSGGYVWYFKNFADTEMRFQNAIESKLLRGRKWAGDLLAAGDEGTEGLIEIAAQGNIFEGQLENLTDVDELGERMEKQGGIYSNYIYGTSSFMNSVSDFLQAENVTGLSWGAFDNNEKMALNLNFSGFKRGAFEYSTTRSYYLSDTTGEGSIVGVNKNHAIMIPSGSKSLRDGITGKSTTEPMLQIRYRAQGAENRKYKAVPRSFDEGTTDGQDRIQTDFLTEKCLQVCGRNNLVLFRG